MAQAYALGLGASHERIVLQDAPSLTLVLALLELALLPPELLTITLHLRS